MNIKAALFMLAALICGSTGHAAIACRVICADPNRCVPLDADVSRAKDGSYKIEKCDAANRVTLSEASVWYSKNAIPVPKVVPKDTSLAATVADGDPSCSNWIQCFVRVKTGYVSGANPMGKQAPVADVELAVIAAGLPFDEVAVPAEGLSFKVDQAPAGASFILMDPTGKSIGTYAANGGRVLVPAQMLQSGGAYAYQWAAPGGNALNGSFKVARANTVKRARETADATVAANAAAANKKLALASAFLQTGLRWNALVLLGEVERGE